MQKLLVSWLEKPVRVSRPDAVASILPDCGDGNLQAEPRTQRP
jgi:hypothetical protein